MEYFKQSETEIKVTRQVEDIISKDDIIKEIESFEKEIAMLQGLIDERKAILAEMDKQAIKTQEEVKALQEEII